MHHHEPFRAPGLWAGLAAALLLAAAPAAAQEAPDRAHRLAAGAPADTVPPPDGPESFDRDTVPAFVLDPLVVEGRSDDMTGIAVTASQGVVGHRDFRLRPLVREAELLETVPGLIMTQHSGDGKSNQMFVRGFNLDHGTDFATEVEGMPVNIPTHAHGQGYTDLNFVVPEMVERVEYRLGPHYAEVGDFGSAGSAHLRLRSSLDGAAGRAGVGEDGYRRIVAAGSVDLGAGELLAGGELKGYDGPWAMPQGLEKKSGMLRYTREGEAGSVSVLAMGYDNAWDATDQIPRRLVRSGRLGRFGHVDPTLGGATSRYSLSATWRRRGAWGGHRLGLYGIAYDLDLWSNFTYHLEDPVRGDQIEQEDEGRRVVGGEYEYARILGAHVLTAGAETRLDLLDVALRHTDDRSTVATVRADDATVWATGAHVELESDWGARFRTVLGLRGDVHRFDVTSDRPANSGTAADGLVSPKASLIWTPGGGAAPGEGSAPGGGGAATEIYLSAGLGFHSNDARGTVQSVDPASGEPVDPVDPLVRSRGAEVGVRTTPVAGWRSTLTAWTVELDSELLFVGDAGTTEPSAASRRLGVTWANYWRATPRLQADVDVSLARARFHEAPEGEDRIPGAIESVVTAGVSWEPEAEGAGPFAALRLRHFGEYALVEDGAVRAPAASLLNLRAGWTFGALRVGASVLNLLDAQESDIQYFYASRMPDEPAGGVEDVHFHPVEPRQVRVSVGWGL